MSSPRPETKKALEIAKQIVLTQGNIFIKELLRAKQKRNPEIHIGTTKEDFQDNLFAAIAQNKITLKDLDEWLQEVEGWGRQHVYLYRFGNDLAHDELWQSPEKVEATVTSHPDHGHAWGTDTSLDFPDQLTISSISFDGNRFHVTWQERYEKWRREKEKDLEPKVIDGDVFQFRAYRQELRRSIMRFELYPSRWKAALFVQIPMNDPRHAAARQLAWGTLGDVFTTELMKPISTSKAIKGLDDLDLKLSEKESLQHGAFLAQNTKFAAKGATVEFDADPAIVAWKNVTAVRQVRRALQANSFSGHSGKFVVQLRSGTGMKRDAVVSISGSDKRVYLWSQMTMKEVWLILDTIMKHAK